MTPEQFQDYIAPRPPRKKRQVKRGGKKPEEILHEEIAGLLRAIIGFAGQTNALGVFWISIENKPRSANAGIANNRRGVKAGFPDLQVIYLGQAHLAEIKTATGRKTEAQEAMHPHLERAGCPVQIWRCLPDVVNSLFAWKIPYRHVTFSPTGYHVGNVIIGP